MAAPDNTVWGNIVTGSKSTRKGRIGIHTSVTSTNTNVTVTVQTWFWSMYSIQDSDNSYYYNEGTSATTLIGAKTFNHTVASGSGWSTSNQTKLGETTKTYDKGTSAQTKSYAAKLTGIDSLGTSNVMTVTTSVTIPALASYTISYNANGGTGAPSAQTKWYGKTLALSSGKPTRNGYAFQGWATSSGGSVAYASGANYTNNSAVTLYAVWKANTYTVTYNANGGTGAPANQTKTYGVALKLSTTIPTRTNYTFKGWGTTASTSTVVYNAGANYTNNSAATLYAVWELSYVKPIIYNFSVTRCDSAGVDADDGSYARVRFEWKTTYSSPTILVEWSSATGGSGSYSTSLSGTSGTVDFYDPSKTFDPEVTYTVTLTLSDRNGSSPATTTLSGATFPIDVLNEGKGVSFGKPAELEGVADFGWDAKFNKPVYGNVLGLNKLPAIPEGAELNDYMNTGSWAIQSNAIAATITCGGVKLGTDDTVPPARACRFEVNSSTGEGIRSQQWSYLRQRLIPYNENNPIWERDIARGADNVWHYYDWWRSSLNPDASRKVYHEQKVLWGGDMTSGMYMTAEHTANLLEKVSDQPNGIILVFSAYESTSDTNYGWQCFFIPKMLVALSTSGHTFQLSRGKYSRIGTKYLYIYDDHITGHADNNLNGTSASGVPYQNDKFVLRYVIGI